MAKQPREVASPPSQQPSGRKTRGLLVRLGVYAALFVAGLLLVQRANRANRDASAVQSRLERLIDEHKGVFDDVGALRRFIGREPVRTSVDEQGTDRETYVWDGIIRRYEVTVVYEDTDDRDHPQIEIVTSELKSVNAISGR